MPSLTKSPLQRIKRGACVLATVFVISVCGFRWLGNFDWVEAVWMVVVTISTVGYAEHSTLSPSEQLFSVMVILFGISASVYTFGGLIQMMLEGELERTLGQRRMTQELSRLRNHVILCGFGRMGQNLAAELHTKHSLVILDRDPSAEQEASSLGYMGVVGDATDEDILMSVGILHATTLVTALPSDAENVFITLTARNLNANLQIIARAELKSTEKKLRQAGATRVVMPTVVGARQMARMISRPTTADLIDLVCQSRFEDLELDEFEIPSSSQLVGVTVSDTEAHRKHKLLVVAIKQFQQPFVFNPDGDTVFQAQDIVILMGHARDIERFRDEFSIE